MGNKQLLKNFDLQINKGEKVLLAARSGSGKTSLLRLILGFTDPDEGKVLFKQKEVSPKNVQKIRRQIAYLSKDVDFPNGKVRDVFREIFQLPANKQLGFTDEKLVEKLAEYQLPEEIMDKNMTMISGGERQRLGWIMLMLLNRPVFLLDEPTSAMDEKQKQRFIDFIVETKKTVVCVSHDPAWQFPGMKVISTL